LCSAELRQHAIMNLTSVTNCLSVMAQELIRKTQGVLIQSKIIRFLYSLTQLNTLHKRLTKDWWVMTVEKNSPQSSSCWTSNREVLFSIDYCLVVGGSRWVGFYKCSVSRIIGKL